MKKSFITLSVLMLLAAALFGCTRMVKYRITEKFYIRTPITVAVLPVYWEAEADKDAETIGRLFRTMSFDRLKELNYRPLKIADADKILSRLTGAALKKKEPDEVAGMLGVDAVIYTHIRKWKKDKFATYAYLGIDARFDMYSRDGVVLWRADYGTKDSDIKLDRGPLELSIIKVYEPRIERLITAVFSTLPVRKTGQGSEKFYDWLP
ncbi:MAG: hypothetical protein ACE5EB_06870 [Thermodesulfobacteriota bacterium]